MWGELCMEEFVMGEENIHEGGARFSSIKKIEYEKVFSTESKEQH